MASDDESNFGSVVNSEAPSPSKTGAPLPALPLVNAFNTPRTAFCCETDKSLFNFVSQFNQKSLVDIPHFIIITDATKSSELGGGSYYTYVITAKDPVDGHVLFETRHRYSEFESLQKLLRIVFPYCVVPPIPEKHTLVDYATKQSKAKDDQAMIDKRKRMLQSFLNRIARHPVMGGNHVFHQFLTESNWNDVLSQSGYAHLLKKKKNAIQKAMEKQTPKMPDPHFVAAEDYTDKFSKHIGYTHNVNRKIIKHYTDLVTSFSELGHLYNTFSLTEMNLSELIEKYGEACDASVSTTGKLVQTLDENFSEPLQEYVHFSKLIEKVLKNRTKRQTDLELLIDSLESKRTYLTGLERAEAEAQRLAAALNAFDRGFVSNPVAVPTTVTTQQPVGTVASTIAPQVPPAVPAPVPTTSTTPTPGALQQSLNTTPQIPTTMPTVSGSTASSGNGGILATLNSFMDSDPEQTRRVNIIKTRAKITELEQEQKLKEKELKELNEGVQKDLNRFQRDKIRDLKKMLLEYAKAQRQHCVEAAKIWNDLKNEVKTETK